MTKKIKNTLAAYVLILPLIFSNASLSAAFANDYPDAGMMGMGDPGMAPAVPYEEPGSGGAEPSNEPGIPSGDIGANGGPLSMPGDEWGGASAGGFSEPGNTPPEEGNPGGGADGTPPENPEGPMPGDGTDPTQPDQSLGEPGCTGESGNQTCVEYNGDKATKTVSITDGTGDAVNGTTISSTISEAFKWDAERREWMTTGERWGERQEVRTWSTGSEAEGNLDKGAEGKDSRLDTDGHWTVRMRSFSSLKLTKNGMNSTKEEEEWTWSWDDEAVDPDVAYPNSDWDGKGKRGFVRKESNMSQNGEVSYLDSEWKYNVGEPDEYTQTLMRSGNVDSFTSGLSARFDAVTGQTIEEIVRTSEETYDTTADGQKFTKTAERGEESKHYDKDGALTSSKMIRETTEMWGPGKIRRSEAFGMGDGSNYNRTAEFAENGQLTLYDAHFSYAGGTVATSAIVVALSYLNNSWEGFWRHSVNGAVVRETDNPVQVYEELLQIETMNHLAPLPITVTDPNEPVPMA